MGVYRQVLVRSFAFHGLWCCESTVRESFSFDFAKGSFFLAKFVGTIICKYW